ncbi:MAG: MacB family efflux pump subunit [Geobacteraceae bacterium]
MQQPLLELTGVGRQFTTGEQQSQVLKDINLTIQSGEMVAIVGASGSGKSTLMNILGCLDRPSEGTYRINGKDTRELGNDELAQLRREHFGFIFQRYHLLPHLDATLNTEIPAVYSGMEKSRRRKQARELLNRLGLGDRLGYRPNQLSGGQQQRVSIARALMNGGDVILADEPTGALDSKSGREMLQLLKELHDQGHTIILVTHDLQVAENAQRIIEIRDGVIIRDQRNGTIKANIPAIAPQMLQSQQRISRFGESWGRFGESLTSALVAMSSHRLRTLLTTLGIIIGITSVVSVVALGQGARAKVISDISSMGTNVIDIYPGSNWGDDKAARIQTLLPADLRALESQSYVDSVTPTVGGSTILRYRNQTANATINGVGESYFQVRGLEFARGAAFDQNDLHNLKQVVVINNNTAGKLFAAGEDPLGKIIFIGNLPCRVIGVTKAKDSPFGNSQNLTVWLPYSAAMSRLFGQQYFNSITVRVQDGLSNQVAEQSIIKLISQRHGIKDFFTSSSDSILKTVKKTTATLSLLISAIAVISLVVGGIGVMNIMLVSVSERTREIGIRMAVGARRKDILQQFLIEAVLVCLTGGIIGIVISYAIGLLFPLFVTAIVMKFSILSIVAAFACSSLIGILFGYLPARNAAALDPVEALARE